YAFSGANKMSAPRSYRPQSKFTKGAVYLGLFFGFLAHSPRALGQNQIDGSVQLASPPQEHTNPEAVTSLQDLLNEAERNNPQIEAARQGWEAAKQVPSQVSTLPDPQFQIQQFSVGSPRPFAGYSNSNFAYIGLG